MDDYYDLSSNRVFTNVRGLRAIQDKSDYIFKFLKYESVIKNMYLIGQDGIVLNTISNSIEIPIMVDGFPYVVLTMERPMNSNRVFCRERFKIVDLVAYNFIRDSDSYLERGYIAINKNGFTQDNHYTNIMYQKKM